MLVICRHLTAMSAVEATVDGQAHSFMRGQGGEKGVIFLSVQVQSLYCKNVITLLEWPMHYLGCNRVTRSFIQQFVHVVIISNIMNTLTFVYSINVVEQNIIQTGNIMS